MKSLIERMLAIRFDRSYFYVKFILLSYKCFLIYYMTFIWSRNDKFIYKDGPLSPFSHDFKVIVSWLLVCGNILSVLLLTCLFIPKCI